MNSAEILNRLVSFQTISRDSNLGLIQFVQNFLTSIGVQSKLVRHKSEKKANLFASIGPEGEPGVVLSGHTDVVPVDGQEWSSDPFQMTERDGRFYGRGTADMKGFLASAMLAARMASKRTLKTPLWLAFSYDEEVGCLGVRSLIDDLVADRRYPRFCIVGEPTSMNAATGHKGKIAVRAVCRGLEAHTAFAPKALNALHLACDLVGGMRAEQQRIAETGRLDHDYEIPYTTIHAAKITGGVAPNIVPGLAEVEFEIRNIAQDNPFDVLESLRSRADRIAVRARERVKQADISVNVVNSYPGLDTPGDAEAVNFVRSLTGGSEPMKVAFGTEGGLYFERFGASVVICGPGSMDQGHKADEYVARTQIDKCERMMEVLVDRLAAGI